MTEQIVQNNHKIIADLKDYAEDVSALTDIEAIARKMAKIRHYISTYRLLEEEFKKKYDNYKNTLLSPNGKNYTEILNNAVKSELKSTLFRNSESFHKYNDPEYFYFPAFVETFDKFGMKKGLYAFYEFYDSTNWSKILEETGHAKEIKTLLEDFCFYFVSLISIDVKLYKGLTDCHFGRYNFESFNLNYIYSIINGVLDYFQELIYKNPDIDYSSQSDSTTNKEFFPNHEGSPTENDKIDTTFNSVELPQELQNATNKEKEVYTAFYKNPYRTVKDVAKKMNYSPSWINDIINDGICDKLKIDTGIKSLRKYIHNIKNSQ